MFAVFSSLQRCGIRPLGGLQARDLLVSCCARMTMSHAIVTGYPNFAGFVRGLWAPPAQSGTGNLPLFASSFQRAPTRQETRSPS